MFQHIGDFCQDKSGFTHKAFVGTFSKILPDCLVQFRFMFLDISSQFFQRADPAVQGQCGACVEICPLFFNDLSDF